MRKVHPDLTEDEIMKISVHSLRVWACVLLYEASKHVDFIKNRLRWVGEFYRLYLRDTPKVIQQHCNALADASIAVMELLDAKMENSFQQLTTEDTNSDEYENKH